MNQKPALTKAISTKFLNSRPKIRIAVLLLLGIGSLIFPKISKAQDYDRYQPLKCMGPIPEELRISASKKFAKELEQLGDSAKGQEGLTRSDFLLQSNFVLEDMLLSGRILFGDPVSEYIIKVKDKILKDEPELQQKIKIYLVKSPVVNAFATNSGVLLVNIGLIAHLQTEAELAYVLCHEIQHYVQKHPINNYVNSENLKSNARNLGFNSSEDFLAARALYSRSSELEADRLGFDLYMKSGYSLAAAEGVFNLLEYADQPWDQLAWDPSFFEWEFMRFPARFTKWPLDTIDLRENMRDTLLSTHPNIAQRRRVIANRIKEGDQDNGEAFLVGVEDFIALRKRCRFELCELFLSDHDYEHAIYNCHLLLVEEPDSRYLKKIVAQSIYALATYKNARRFSEAHLDADRQEGEFQQVTHFMEMGDRECIMIVALHEAWKTYLADSTDEELKDVAEDLMLQIFAKHHRTTEWLAHEKPETMPGLIDSLLQVKKLTLQRRGLIALEDSLNTEDVAHVEEQSINTREENNFLEWALTDLFQDERFVKAWDECKDHQSEIEEESYESANNLRAMTKRERLRGVHLGIDKLVIVQPIYKRVDLRAKIPVEYVASETSLESYKETLAEMSQRHDIAYQFLENRNLEVGDVEQFNDVSTMLLWFSDHLNGSDEKVKLVNFRKTEAQDIIARYGTRYFAWNGVIRVTDRKSERYRFVLVYIGLTIFPALPLALYYANKPNHETLFVTLIFDLQDSDSVLESYRLVKAKDRKSVLRSSVYDIFNQIK